jgi:hypothetical protein
MYHRNRVFNAIFSIFRVSNSRLRDLALIYATLAMAK